MSICAVAVTDDVPPSASVTDLVTDTFFPEVDNTTGAGQLLANGDDPAVHTNLTVTGVRYQPAPWRRVLDSVVAITGSIGFAVGVGDGEGDADVVGVGVGVGGVPGCVLEPTCSMTVPEDSSSLGHPEKVAVTVWMPEDRSATGPST
jgi:hypothetical protein